MVAVALKCPYCGSEDVRPYGSSTAKKRYACNNPACTHKPFYTEYTYNGCTPEVKREILKWGVDGAGIGATARELGVSTDRVIKELKKRGKARVGEQRVSFIPRKGHHSG